MAIFDNATVTSMFVAVLTLQATTIIALVPLARKVITQKELEERFTQHTRRMH